MMTKTSQPGAEPANVFENRQTPGQWRVEWFDDDGRCELEIFTGQDARRRRCGMPCASTATSGKCSYKSRARRRACVNRASNGRQARRPTDRTQAGVDVFL